MLSQRINCDPIELTSGRLRCLTSGAVGPRLADSGQHGRLLYPNPNDHPDQRQNDQGPETDPVAPAAMAGSGLLSGRCSHGDGIVTPLGID